MSCTMMSQAPLRREYTASALGLYATCARSGSQDGCLIGSRTACAPPLPCGRCRSVSFSWALPHEALHACTQVGLDAGWATLLTSHKTSRLALLLSMCGRWAGRTPLHGAGTWVRSLAE